MLSTLSNDISEATGPIGPKFHLWHPWAGGLKVFAGGGGGVWKLAL